MSTHILVIKHGALGDIIVATAGFAAIRAAYKDAHITCLTSKPYAELLRASPYFDEVIVDSKPKLWNLGAINNLRRFLRSRDWAWVYDMQMSGRTHRYMRLLRQPYPNISSNLAWVSHSCADGARATRHAYTNLQQQMQVAGLTIGQPDVRWMKADITAFLLITPYVLLVPGGAPHRPEKRWPAAHYTALAQALVARGYTPVLLGTNAEAAELNAIANAVPQAINLCGKTSMVQLAELGRNAALAVGNDTGPMHVIAATSCPAIVLFSHASDPARCAPIGKVTVLRREKLADLSATEVLHCLTDAT